MRRPPELEARFLAERIQRNEEDLARQQVIFEAECQVHREEMEEQLPDEQV